MENKIISIDITPNSLAEETVDNAGVMWEHNATVLKFNLDTAFVGDYRYYIEYRSLMGTKVRTEYLELETETNTVTYYIPVTMSSLKGIECYFNIVSIDSDGITQQVIKPKKFCLTFDYSSDIDNSLAKVNDFSVNALLEAIRLGTFKGDKGDKGDTGDKGDKGDTGGISEEYASSNFANSLKGNSSGSVVSVEDISPVEHSLTVTVDSKNLLQYPYVKSTETINGVTFTDNGDGTITMNGTATSTITYNMYAAKLWSAYGFKLNQNYMLSGMPADSGCRLRFYFSNGGTHPTDIGNGAVINLTTDAMGYFQIYVPSGTTVENVVVSPQLEEGTTATEYTPRIDPTNANVTLCGKNTFDNTKWINAEESEINGVKCLKVTDGDSAAMTYKVEGGREIAYILTCRIYRESGNEEKGSNIKAKRADGTERSVASNIMHNTVFTGIVYGGDTLYFTGWSLPLYVDLTVTQLEVGNVATEFEEYKATTVTVNADGSVTGLVSVSPKMTIFADADGTKIYCEYNKDINKVVEKLINAIVALGGNV